MFLLPFHERRHLERLLTQQGSIKFIFDEFVRKVGFHMQGWKDTTKDDLWVRNANVEKAIEKELTLLHKKLVVNIESFVTDAWKASHIKTDDLVKSYIEGMALPDVVKNGMFARNHQALKTFLDRKVEGLTISDRVWNVTGTAKENIEHYLSSGLSTGRPASLISQDIRQLLKEPDRRFHRIRNADGKLAPSAPMKDYNPGRGVYRSSYKNALRLAATNTNEIYRQTDCERWSRLGFVLGIEIKRSKSTKYGDCVICDPLAGKYPKDYVFKGWHPFCICVATPILMDEDKFVDSLVDENPKPPEGLITDIPQNSRKYFDIQLDKRNVSLKSYLFKDNQKFFEDYRPEGKGYLKMLAGVDESANDFKGVLASAKYFATKGSTAKVLPVIRTPNDPQYKEIFGSLKGTKYYRKCPDLLIDGKFYEHEGFKTNNPKTNLRNMFHRGLKQSDRLIIQDCGLSKRYMLNNVFARIKQGQDIAEVWVLRKDGKLFNIYKKTED